MKQKKSFWSGVCLLAAFVLWTAGVAIIDVQPVGPEGSMIGFATVNSRIHRAIGVHMGLYTLTDWLSLVPLAIVMGFALQGLAQWVNRKHLRKVDPQILILGGYYGVVFSVYAFFERLVVNYRPVLIGGALEASYPSSTTVLTLCVMLTAVLQLDSQIQNKAVRKGIAFGIHAFSGFMVIGRFLSGVHWFTDIVGGILLSAGLVSLYKTCIERL